MAGNSGHSEESLHYFYADVI